MTPVRFREIVWAHYKKSGRHDLPWRNLPAGRQGQRNPYKILVSEVMLQQTQVERVILFYKTFITKFPTVHALANAPLSDVLKAWQGLGYNRRAKMLHLAAKEMVATRFDLKNSVPRSNLVTGLGKLPCIGPYTARAVAAFAFNQDVILLETNIRTTITHHFFSRRSDVADTELVEVLKKLLPKGRSREWYSALLDYGAYLKKSGVKLNAKSRHYTKQSKFSGSLRQARGAILRALATKSYQGEALLNLFGLTRRTQMQTALTALQKEEIIQIKKGRFSLSE